MNLRRALVLLIVLVGLVLGFVLFVDVTLMGSETTTEAGTGTSQLGNATAPLEEPLTIVVLGEGPLTDGLADSLEAELGTRFSSVVTSTNASQSVEGPVLAVRVTDRAVDYNPFLPSARVTAEFAFVGTGNATFATALTTGSQLVVTNEEPYVVHGDLTLTDRSRGFATRPGYYRHLRGTVADTLSEELLSAPGME